ncbi:MAG: hypothetical protein ACJ8I9_08830 [Chthoniobacterales bacterium]
MKKAIARTFDGGHPCDLCKRVVAEQQLPKKSDTAKFQTKPDLICAARMIVLWPQCREINFPDAIILATEQDSSPPTPPPRFARVS